MGIIKQIAEERNQTIVMVTHDTEIAKFANKVIHIHDGHIERIEEEQLNEEN